MNNINFIKKIVPQQQLEFYKWLKISIIFLVSFVFCALIINFLQFYKISKLNRLKIKKEKELINFEEIMKNKNNLKLQFESMQNEILKIEDAKMANKQIVDYLKQISDFIPNETYLKTLNYSNSLLELNGISFDADLVSSFIKSLSKLPFFKNVKLVYLKLLNDQTVENTEKPHLEFLIRIKLNGSKL